MDLSLHSLQRSSTAAKLGWVAAGYVAALVLARAAIWLNDLARPASAASAGMSAFGDAVLFVGVFLLAACFPTGLAAWLWLTSRKTAA